MITLFIAAVYPHPALRADLSRRERERLRYARRAKRRGPSPQGEVGAGRRVRVQGTA
jgi:hypothetical protein